MPSMIRPVQYARALDGKLIAVEQGPHKGWAIGDTVYATESEANSAAGKLNQKIYLDGLLEEIDYGLGSLVDSASPFAGWRESYDQRERQADLVEEIIRGLFPEHGPRSEYAERFAEAFSLADQTYRELRAP